MNPRYVLIFAVAMVSTAALLIRLAGDAPPLVVGAYRLGIASLVVLPLALVRGELRGFPRSLLLPGLASGVCLALHFGFWISSLQHTSVASSVLLVTTNPLLVAAASPLVPGDRPSHRTVAGILVALSGSAAIAYGDAGIDPGSLFGNALALAGSAAVAAHYLIGRQLRARLSLLAYIAVAYPVAAVCLLLAAVATGNPLTGFAAPAYLWMVLLGLGPQVLGHSSLNWALKHLSAVAVTAAVMGEPVGASLSVWLVLGEAPTLLQVAGGAVVLAGVFLALKPERAVQAGG